jgi:peptide chain release factor 2
LPTKISVSSQNERSQHQNKELALEILKSKLYKLAEEKKIREEHKLKGDNNTATWGRQIRSYVMQPYKMVKDHRSNYSTDDIDSVLDGDLDKFIEAYLKNLKSKK